MATPRRILVVHYSQTGQLTRISESFVKPFEAAGMEVDWLPVAPSKPYNFPWSAPRFFDAFPESVDRIPCELEPLEVKGDREYDLVILAYQVWFMNISIPMNSFLKLPEAAHILKGKPVVTLIGCRNMWVMAQEDMKQRLVAFGSNLVGNVALIDRTSNLVGLITVLGWMLKGKKEKLFGFMPASGVSEEDIAHCSEYGQTVL
ncbi:MAG: dialkylresorcinol condensing enzyme DarA, partial [Flavobacteriales bacterium]|nr:dialkylresorcinol condensing enzyme DarA [Flavobacteriales bacterium]